MLELKKEIAEFDIIVKKDKGGKYTRTSKPFKNDNKTRDFFTLHLRMLSRIGSNGKRMAGAQVNTIHRNIWSDRQSVVFDDITEEIVNGNIDERHMLTDMGLEGAFYIAPAPRPYNQTIDGVTRPQKFVRFFVLMGESPEQEYERACSGLDYITEEDIETRDEDAEAAKESAKPSEQSESAPKV